MARRRFGSAVSSHFMIIILVQSCVCRRRCRCNDLCIKQKHIIAHCVIVDSTCLVLNLSTLSILVASSFITNATCCDTDNCIALFHLHHLSAVFVVIARCCLKFLFSLFFVFLLSPLWLHIPLCLTMTSRLHALPSTLSMFAIHVTIYLMMLLSLSMHVDVIICKLCKQICYVLQLQQY